MPVLATTILIVVSLMIIPAYLGLARRHAEVFPMIGGGFHPGPSLHLFMRGAGRGRDGGWARVARVAFQNFGLALYPLRKGWLRNSD